MAKSPSQTATQNGQRIRFCVVAAIVIAHFIGWFWLSGFTRGEENLALLDQLLCPITFISCANPHDIASWMQLVLTNAIAFAVWILFLLAARAFVMGKSLVGQLLGLAACLFIPAAILAVFFFGLVLSSIS